MLNKIRYVARNPEFLMEYFNRTKHLSRILRTSREDIKLYIKESSFIWQDVQQKLENTNEFRMSKERLGVLYACVRSLKPDIMIETGVAGGTTSWAILDAMRKNRKGYLYSIDIGLEDIVIGWLVPNALRGNWNLIIGDSKTELPALIRALGKEIDIFFHDSLHTYDHMTFEFNTVMPFLKSPKVILCDDIELNSAFTEFVMSKNLLSAKFYGFGVATTV